MNAAQQRGWMKFTALGIGLFGPLFSLGTVPALAEPARWSLDLLAWPLDGAQDYAADTTRFLTAITGGFLLGWGVMVWGLATRLHPLAPEPVRRIILAGLLAWFMLDSAGSIASGHAANAGFNIIVLLILVGPLWWPAREG
ncbi:hypothetical protein CHU93_13790 [Sandarakinorhabdus cyanobacteriorum]|uniref:Uncharacterized protein n=1 Tax=Sandarakinorhabdus cyanobacteriorum TaxID=1981098 RepID=A0A255Y868_9SPHN|nr:hypothetical protein [Sandarakinorhabdus cyanobacteriorum]OYQ25323.1 hypothetical protein CHU93_13790 [Sandarakinorhabdus cyanobacteriorum]